MHKDLGHQLNLPIFVPSPPVRTTHTTNVGIFRFESGLAAFNSWHYIRKSRRSGTAAGGRPGGQMEKRMPIIRFSCNDKVFFVKSDTSF